MNLYLRYFDEETLVHSVDEALVFLASLGDFEVTDNIRFELEKFLQNSAMFPKHIKVHARSFFIVIKTTAETMEEFKAKGAAGQNKAEKNAQKEIVAQYAQPQPGWYKAKLTFKRVVILPETQKARYVDAPFAVRLRAESIQDCYDRIVAYLRTRRDIDPRSQYPSIKSPNFEYSFLGE